MPPKTAKQAKSAPKVYTTPPDCPSVVYGQYIVIALKDENPVSTLPADQRFEKGKKGFKDIMGFFPYLKLNPAQRMKTGKFLLDERDGYKEMSVFCRVEDRIEEHRVSSLIADLNSRFQGLPFADRAKLKMTLIRNFGEKMLKDWSYNERDPIKGKIIYTKWNEVGTRSKTLERLPQSGANVTESDNDSDPDGIFMKKRKGSSKKLSSSECSSTAPTPKKDETKSAKSGTPKILDNPFFTPAKTSQVKKDVSGGKKSGTIALPAGKSPASKSSAEKKSASKAEAKKDATRVSARTSGKRRHVSESDSDSSDDSIKYVGTQAAKSPLKKPHLEAMPAPEDMEVQTPDLPSASSGETVTNVEIPVMSEFTEATLITEDHFDAKMDKFLEKFVSTLSTSDALKHLVRQQVELVFLESMAPFLNDLKYEVKDAIKDEVAKVLAGQVNIAKRAALAKLMEDTNAMKTAIADFSVEHAAIRVEIGKLREYEADAQSRCNGILARMLPFEFMGPAADIFFASHFVQENIIHFMKDDLTNMSDKVNVTIAFAFTNAFFTRMALAHLVWKHPQSEEQMMYYKRTMPEPVERIITTIVIPFVKKEMELRNSNLVIVWKKIRKVISRRFTNSRTKMLEWAFKKTFTPEEGFEALFNIDNEFCLYNEHAVPPVAIDDLDAYVEKLTNNRKEAKNALLASQDEKWVDGTTFPPMDKVFDGFRGKSYTRKVWSKYDTIKLIVAAAAAKKEDVTKLTWDEIDNVPDLKAVYEEVLVDYQNQLDDLVREFPHDPEYMVKIKSNSSSEEQSAVQSPVKRVSRSQASDESSTNDDEQDDDDESVLTQAPKEEPASNVTSRDNTPPDNADEVLGVEGTSSTDPATIKEQLAIEKAIKKAIEKKK